MVDDFAEKSSNASRVMAFIEGPPIFLKNTVSFIIYVMIVRRSMCSHVAITNACICSDATLKG